MRRRLLLLAAAGPLAWAAVAGGRVAALPDAPGPRGERTAEQAAIERQPVCVGSTIASAGTLADVLYYRAVATDDGRVAVGYFVFFSEERPWGNNWLTWSFIPALSIDLVYSRALLVAPGLQRALYGPGDVEGIAAIYDVGSDGELRLDHAIADDDREHPTVLTRAGVFAIDPARPTFVTDVWSHQLGSRSARTRGELVTLRCYEGDSIRPLPDEVARRFRLDERRAAPAHVECTAGRRVDRATATATVPALCRD
jgi:hypothetical protein